MTAKTFQLKNGIRCLLYDTNCACHQSITINIMFKVGPLDEPSEYHGLSHFAEHMFFKATKKRSNGNIISSEIEQYGAIFNAITDHDVTYYYIKIDKKYFENALDILSDILFNSLFKQSDINAEKEVIINELKLYENDPSRRSNDMLSKLIYKDTPFEHNIGGNIDVIRNATRTKFLNYISYFYKPENVIISIAGSIPSESKTKLLLNKYFNKHFTYHKLLNSSKSTKSTTNKSNAIIPFTPRQCFHNFDNLQKSPRFHYKLLDHLNSSYIVIGFPGYKYHSPEYYQMLLLSTILGKGMSSRLFLEVREKRGLTYSIKSNISCYQDLGIFTINCATHSTDIKKTFQIIWNELNKIKKGKITNSEIQKAKENILGSEILSRENTTYLARTNAYNFICLNTILSLDDFTHFINSVSKSQIVNLSKSLFQKNKLNVAVISNIKLSKN